MSYTFTLAPKPPVRSFYPNNKDLDRYFFKIQKICQNGRDVSREFEGRPRVVLATKWLPKKTLIERYMRLELNRFRTATIVEKLQNMVFECDAFSKEELNDHRGGRGKYTVAVDARFDPTTHAAVKAEMRPVLLEEKRQRQLWNEMQKKIQEEKPHDRRRSSGMKS